MRYIFSKHFHLWNNLFCEFLVAVSWNIALNFSGKFGIGNCNAHFLKIQDIIITICFMNWLNANNKDTLIRLMWDQSCWLAYCTSALPRAWCYGVWCWACFLSCFIQESYATFDAVFGMNPDFKNYFKVPVHFASGACKPTIYRPTSWCSGFDGSFIIVFC